MTLPFFGDVFKPGLLTSGGFLFLSLLLVAEIGYRVGRLAHHGRPVRGDDLSSVATLTAGMLGLLAFTLSLSIGFAQNRYEARRGLVLAEANAIGTAWLRAKLIDGDEGRAIAAKIEDYARVRLDFTTAAADADIAALVARTHALQTDIWQSVQGVAHSSPNQVTTALVTALNEMFDDATSQRFAYESSVPVSIVLGLYFGSLLSISALSYQFGLTGQRYLALSWLLLAMLSGAMLLIVDLNLPRVGSIKADAAPLVWTIQGFGDR
jgi:hypothetical protein